jgi:hypothetical protein
MATVENPQAIDQAQLDAEEVMRLVAAGQRVTDPELRERIRKRADIVRKQIFDKFGVVNWAVDMIREARDE